MTAVKKPEEVKRVDENKMLRALKRKDEKALEWFIDHYAGYVNTIIFNIIGSFMTESDIEEVSSDVFLVLWENAKKIEKNKVKAYLGAVARNKAKEKMRENGQDIPLEEDILIISNVDLEQDFEIREQALIVKKAILMMQHPDREIFLRHYYYYQPLAQIAEELEINISTIKTKLRRGREKIKVVLREGGYDIGKENI
mgnify:CR=1 FL=1